MECALAGMGEGTCAADSRAFRLATRAAQHREKQENHDIRLLTAEAVRKKEEADAEATPAKVLLPSDARPERSFRDSVVEDELRRVVQAVPKPPLVAALPEMVHLDLRPTPASALSVKLHFPLGYPQDSLIINLHSPTLHPQLMARLHQAALLEAQKMCPKAQVLAVIAFLRGFLETNLLAPAFADLLSLRQLFQGSASKVLSTRERGGLVDVHLVEARYYLDLRCTIPREYPQDPASLQLLRSNLPAGLAAAAVAQAAERAQSLARPPKLAQPGLGAAVGREGGGAGPNSKAARLGQAQTHLSRKREAELVAASEEAKRAARKAQQQSEASFIARPSLLPSLQFLLEERLRLLAAGRCAACTKRLLPSDPEKAGSIPRGLAAELLYCGHTYHRRCLEDYLGQPPFDKGCEACGTRISHPGFECDPKVRELRLSEGRGGPRRSIASFKHMLLVAIEHRPGSDCNSQARFLSATEDRAEAMGGQKYRGGAFQSVAVTVAIALRGVCPA